jgi:hypothetical protein
MTQSEAGYKGNLFETQGSSGKPKEEQDSGFSLQEILKQHKSEITSKKSDNSAPFAKSDNHQSTKARESKDSEVLQKPIPSYYKEPWNNPQQQEKEKSSMSQSQKSDKQDLRASREQEVKPKQPTATKPSTAKDAKPVHGSKGKPTTDPTPKTKGKAAKTSKPEKPNSDASSEDLKLNNQPGLLNERSSEDYDIKLSECTLEIER